LPAAVNPFPASKARIHFDHNVGELTRLEPAASAQKEQQGFLSRMLFGDEAKEEEERWRKKALEVRKCLRGMRRG